jgi:hypothetical protein
MVSRCDDVVLTGWRPTLRREARPVRIDPDELPVTVEFPGYSGKWTTMGDLHFAFESCAAGSDIDGLISIFPDQACPVEHWGIVYRGKVRVEYTDGTEETFSAGDTFYVQPGHRPYMLEDTELLQLTDKQKHADFIRQIAEAGLIPSA